MARKCETKGTPFLHSFINSYYDINSEFYLVKLLISVNFYVHRELIFGFLFLLYSLALQLVFWCHLFWFPIHLTISI